MRIVYYTPPSTPAGYFGLAVKSALLAYVGTAVLYFIFGLSPSQAGVFGVFHNLFSPVSGPLFIWAGLYDLPVAASGLYTIFVLLLAPALLNAIPMMRLKTEQLDILDEAYGPVKKPEHISWFVIAAGLAMISILTRYFEVPPHGGLYDIFLDCTRLLAVLVSSLTAICFVIIGWRLRGSWLKSPAAIRAPKPAKVRHLKIAVDNTAPVKPVAPALATDDGLYIALTAEIIQCVGRTGNWPTTGQLLPPLETLQKAALMTRSGQYHGTNLKDLCEKASALLESGQVKSLQGPKAAQALYTKAQPGKLTAIASELKRLLQA